MPPHTHAEVGFGARLVAAKIREILERTKREIEGLEKQS
jgi:hypothetical protein